MPYKIIAHSHGQRWELQSQFAGLSLLEELQQQQVPIKSSCLGKGLCHQCRVQVSAGVIPISAADRKTFSEEQLKQGWRLSCMLRPKTRIELNFPQIFIFGEQAVIERQPQGEWWLVCDLGTTGVELAGVDQDGVWGVVHSLNRQVSMGADVMTRLEYAQRNGTELLFTRIHDQLVQMIAKLTKEATSAPQHLWVAGNSAVTAFLCRQSVATLAVSPYQPESLAAQTLHWGDLEVHTLPLLYSFVGGDLFAGLFYLWQQKEQWPSAWVLMDVGTNSEILFWDGATLFVSSTPAGPAFEGSSISIGMRAERGAVLNPRFTPQGWQFNTLGGDVARGICGSALIDMVAELVRHNLIRADGEVLKPEALALNGDLALNQDDIREFQLAKSAIATGLQLVQSEGQARPEKLYLAGAFGAHLNLDHCWSLGLLPRLPIETLGNSSLKGAIDWSKASSGERERFAQWLQSHLRPIELALRDDFQEAFVHNMALQEWSEP